MTKTEAFKLLYGYRVLEEYESLERDLAEAVRLLEELLADCDADLKPTKKHPARVFLTSLKERT